MIYEDIHQVAVTFEKYVPRFCSHNTRQRQWRSTFALEHFIKKQIYIIRSLFMRIWSKTERRQTEDDPLITFTLLAKCRRGRQIATDAECNNERSQVCRILHVILNVSVESNGIQTILLQEMCGLKQNSHAVSGIHNIHMSVGSTMSVAFSSKITLTQCSQYCNMTAQLCWMRRSWRLAHYQIENGQVVDLRFVTRYMNLPVKNTKFKALFQKICIYQYHSSDVVLFLVKSCFDPLEREKGRKGKLLGKDCCGPHCRATTVRWVDHRTRRMIFLTLSPELSVIP